MWKGRGWSPVSNHGRPWWGGKGSGKGWRMLASVEVSLHEYDIGLKSDLLQIKVIFIPKVTLFPHCLEEMTNVFFSCWQSLPQSAIYKTDLWIAGTGCLQKSKWNWQCHPCVLNTWHWITGGNNSSPMLSVQSWSSPLVNRWHGREYFSIGTNFSVFLSFLGGTESCKHSVLSFSSPAILRGAGEKYWDTEYKGLRERERDTHIYMYYVYSLWLYAAQNSILTLCIVSLWAHGTLSFLDLTGEKRSSATCGLLPSVSFLPVARTGKGQYRLCISSLICVSSWKMKTILF